MADYPYDGQLIADPVTFQRATNAQISVYDAADTGNTTKLALKDTSGLPLPNPLTSTADAFTVPFYAPSQDIKLVGAGLTVFVSSAKGMRDAAAAAADAAQQAASEAVAAAGDRVTTAAVNGAGKLILTKATGAQVDAGAVIGPKGDKGDKGSDGSNVLPTDTAIKQAITTPGTETAAALSATYLDKASGLTKAEAATAYARAGDVVSSTREEFTGTALGPEWFVVRPSTGGAAVSGGTLQIKTLPGELSGSVETAQNIVLQAAPAAPWRAEAKITAALTGQFQSVGLIAYSAKGSYAFAHRVAVGTNVRSRFYLNSANNGRSIANLDYTDASTASTPTTWWVRMENDGLALTAYTSADGTTWTPLGRPVALNGRHPAPTQIGFAAHDSAGGAPVTASIDYFELSKLDPSKRPVRLPELWVTSRTAADPATTLSNTVRSVLRNCTKYAMNTWWTTKYASQDAQPYIDFGGIEEANIRQPASQAFGLAVALATGAYDQTAAGGVNRTTALSRTTRLVSSLAYRHTSNQRVGGWMVAADQDGQTAQWSALTATAAWMVWPHISAADKNLILNMLITEADNELMLAVPFWKNRAGVEVYAGDSKSDSLGWRSLVTSAAAAMLPTHPHAGQWRARTALLGVAAWSRPSDVTNTGAVDGKQVADYLNGWNINENGTVINHDILHPDYMAAAQEAWFDALVRSMVNEPITRASIFNGTTVYKALTDLVFTTAEGYAAPGGTIYKPGASTIYYPQGTDWGTSRRADKACIDVLAFVLGRDAQSTTKGDAWGQLHAQAALDMQARFTTGQTYDPADDDAYAGREEWVTLNMARAWLALFLKHREVMVGNWLP